MPDAGIHKFAWKGIDISFREAPLTLTTLAALVPDDLNCEIRIVDESVDKIPLDETYDLVGISCLTGTASKAYALATQFRTKGATVVLGGIHVTLMPDEASHYADAIIIGFAEQTWPQLLRDYINGQLKKSYHSEISGISQLPEPRRDLQKRFGYMMPNTVFATRGCKGNCDFCSVSAVPFGWQTRPVGDVIDEVKRIKTKRFAFNDVSLCEDRDYAMELFQALAPLKKQWGGLATLQVASDPELLETIAKSGCIFLLIGFESASDNGLQSISKRFNKSELYKNVVDNLHQYGITVQGCFIFGLDSDDNSIFDYTVNVVNELKIDIPRYAIYTPYPGTAAYQRLKREKRILHENWLYYDTQHVVFKPAQMTPEELNSGFVSAYRKTFKMSSILSRTFGSGRFPVTFVGNLAYRIYIKRLLAEEKRFYLPGTVNSCEV